MDIWIDRQTDRQTNGQKYSLCEVGELFDQPTTWSLTSQLSCHESLGHLVLSEHQGEDTPNLIFQSMIDSGKWGVPNFQKTRLGAFWFLCRIYFVACQTCVKPDDTRSDFVLSPVQPLVQIASSWKCTIIWDVRLFDPLPLLSNISCCEEDLLRLRPWLISGSFFCWFDQSCTVPWH